MTVLSGTNGIVIPNGYNQAYTATYRGHGYIQPVPNQVSAIRGIGYSQGEGVLYSYYSNIQGRLKLEFGSGRYYYWIPSQNETPDHTFRTVQNTSTVFNSATTSFSNNGRYMFVDVPGIGFTRVNMMNLKNIAGVAQSPLRTSSGGLLGASTAIDDTGRYAAIAYNAPAGWGLPYFKIVDIANCHKAEQEQTPVTTPERCEFIDAYSQLKQSVPTIKSVSNVQFVNDRTVGFVVAYADSQGVTQHAQYSLTAFGQVKRLKEYIAVGDSYISGEGAYNYRVGTDTENNRCHQSTVSYPYLLSQYFNSSVSVACSGARTMHVQDEDSSQLIGRKPTDVEVVEARSGHMPGYIGQKRFVNEDNPEAVTVSIGGNDIGFGQILERCVHPLKNIGENIDSDFTCYNTYEDRKEVMDNIDSHFSKLRELYETLRDGGTGGRRVYVIGYPQIAKVGGNCGNNVLLNDKEVRFAHDLIKHLNGVIEKAADEAGVMYVDTESAFNGVRLCEGSGLDMAMNGFTISKTPGGGHDFRASYHPNKLGHEKLAAVIADQTDNLTKPMPGKTPKTNQIITPPNDPIYQGLEHTGRLTRQIANVENLVARAVSPLQSVGFTIPSIDHNFKPGGVYKISLGGRDLGNFTADAEGNLTVNAVIPANMTPGFQTLHVTGSDAFGTPVDVQQNVYISAKPDDMDGDGILNDDDSCVAAVQSGQDVDQDGTDDVCDPLIGNPPANPPDQEDGIIWWDNAVMPITIETTTGP